MPQHGGLSYLFQSFQPENHREEIKTKQHNVIFRLCIARSAFQLNQLLWINCVVERIASLAFFFLLGELFIFNKRKCYLFSLSGISLLMRAVVTCCRVSRTSSHPIRILVARDNILLCSSWEAHTAEAHTYVTTVSFQ